MWRTKMSESERHRPELLPNQTLIKHNFNGSHCFLSHSLEQFFNRPIFLEKRKEILSGSRVLCFGQRVNWNLRLESNGWQVTVRSGGIITMPLRGARRVGCLKLCCFLRASFGERFSLSIGKMTRNNLRNKLRLNLKVRFKAKT